jgi:F0F1-type ATP synthase assembly protein I
MQRMDERREFPQDAEEGDVAEELGEAVSERARKAAEEGEAALRDIEGRLTDLESRSSRLATAHKAAEEEVARNSITGSAAGRGLGRGLAAAYALIGMPLLGLGLGWLLDRGTDSNVFSLVGFVLGGAAAVWFASRQLSRA